MLALRGACRPFEESGSDAKAVAEKPPYWSMGGACEHVSSGPHPTNIEEHLEIRPRGDPTSLPGCSSCEWLALSELPNHLAPNS